MVRDEDREARPAGTPVAIALLAMIALLAQALDLVSAVRMIQHHGISAELNPLARMIAGYWGTAGLTAIKLAGVIVGVSVIVYVGRFGRVVLAGAALGIAAAAGLVGYYSNVY